MTDNEKFHIAFKTVEVTDLSTGQIVHREDIARRGLSIVTNAIMAADGEVSISEEGLRWADEVRAEEATTSDPFSGEPDSFSSD